MVWRQVDDDAHVSLRFDNGARGHLWASQVAAGCQNALSLRVFGSHGSLSFRQEAPDELWYTQLGAPTQRLTRGGPGLGAAAAQATRIPGGHPEGYLEAFAQLYREMADQIHARQAGQTSVQALPDVQAGADGMHFVEAALRSHAQGGTWVALKA